MDHSKRQRDICLASIGVIEREGLEAATIRRIAQELGYSTKVVTHYFPSKKELLLSVFAVLAEIGHQRADVAIERDPTGIVDLLFTMTAAGEEGVRRWRTYVAFLEWAARDADAGHEQRRYLAIAIARIARMIEAHGLAADRAEYLSRLLNAFVQGISLQALLDRERWSEERLRAVIEFEVATLIGREATA